MRPRWPLTAGLSIFNGRAPLARMLASLQKSRYGKASLQGWKRELAVQRAAYPCHGLKGIIFDIDGTLVRGPGALPGAVRAVTAAQACGLRIVFCTQDSIDSRASIASRLRDLGFKALPGDIVSAGWLAARYLGERYRGAPIYVMGSPNLRRTFSVRGINVASDRDAQAARAVFVAGDAEFTAGHFNAACMAIWNGADFFGVGYDRVFSGGSPPSPGPGPIIKTIEYVTGRRARIIGKPSLGLAAAALRRLKTQPHETAVVGDQPYADIRMGKFAGCKTVLVLTGGASAADARRIPLRWRPDAVLTGVHALPEWIARWGE